MKTMKAFDTACRMALDLSKNYTWDAFCKLTDFCIENDITYYEDEEEGKIYIEDYGFSIVD